VSATEDPPAGASWLSDRVGWTAIRRELSSHHAPLRSFFFYLGGITLFLLVLQVASGVLLLLYYRPDAAQAYASVERTVGEVPYGSLVHSLHLWASDLFVVCLLAHPFTILVRRSFRPPHELSWLSGVVSLGLGIGLAFTGALLPWSEAAYTDARVGSELARYVPVVGDGLSRFLRGGEEVTSTTLVRAFGFHVAVLPAALTAVVAAHLFFVSRKPLLPPARSKGEAIPLVPDFLVRLGVALTAVLVLAMTLAIFAERPLGPPADPRLPSPANARPPWYLLAVHQLVATAPKELLGVEAPRFFMSAACGIGLVVMSLPFLDRRGSKVTAWFAWALLLAFSLLTVRALR
jgi:cytochrome b6